MQVFVVNFRTAEVYVGVTKYFCLFLIKVYCFLLSQYGLHGDFFSLNKEKNLNNLNLVLVLQLIFLNKRC